MKFRTGSNIFLVLMLYWNIISLTRALKSCPQSETILPCRCSLKGDEMQIWCSHSNLPQIIEGIKSVERTIPTTIDELILENNQLPALPGRFFGTLNIARLMLRYNSIERVSNGWLNQLEKSLVEIFIVEPRLRTIPPESLNNFQNVEAITIQSDELKRLPDFSGLTNLKYLSIQSKSLIEIPPKHIKHLPKLQNIHLNNAVYLTRLEAGLFENLPSLKTIDLSRNGINWIHLRSFYHLPNLISLKLSQNQISDVGMIGRVVKDLENLQKLRLDKNLIGVLNEGSFVDLPLLTELYLNENRITELQYGAFNQVPNLKVIYLQNNRIRRIHPESFIQPSNSGVESLYLHNNEINRIEELRSLLDALPALKFLDLSHNLLTGIPFGALRGHGTLEQLHLNDNNLKHIDRDALMAMPALRELRLRNNSLSDNLLMPLWNLPGLKGLDLSENYFRQINSALLSGVPSLRRLDLSRNFLEIIDPTTFIHTTMLETLNISNNEINEIHQATFRNLHRLFEIDASSNKLQEIIPGLPKIVERISVRSNMITQMPETINKYLNLPHLRMLDISQNYLEYLPKLTFQSLLQLRVLSLAQNRIKLIEDKTFIGLNHLELLNLQDNQISEINDNAFEMLDDLHDLNLQNNKLEKLPENLFLNNTNLAQLDLSKNVLKELPELIFNKLKYLQYLDLSMNMLTKLPESSKNLITLIEIDFSYNNLLYLQANLIESWKNIIEIRGSNNQLVELKYGTIKNLPKLQYLDLSSNDIKSIEPNALKNLQDLQELVLADNKLIELKDHVFENLPNLQAAHLQHNMLKYLSTEAFHNSPFLLYLNLSTNYFRNMDNIGLRNMRSLEVLDVSANAIRTIKTMPLKTLNWLVELKMDNNQICKINGSPFETMPRLRVLSIRNNQLKTMNEKIFKNLRGNIAILDIDGNPLLCTCDVLWLSAWLDETNSPDPGPTCKNGKLLRESRLVKNECGDLRSSNQLPLLNEHGDYFGRQLNDEFIEDCDPEYDANDLNDNKQKPLPGESEYFYDQYIDFPNHNNETTHSLITGNRTNPIQISTGLHHNIPANNNILDLNNTILNYNLYNKKPEENSLNPQGSSAFTFFGYPLPSLSFGKFLNSNGRNTDGGIKKSTTPSRGKVRMFRPTDSEFEKYLKQETQYHDISSRNYYPDGSNENADSKNSFRTKTTFNKPQIERGGFYPIIPRITDFVPVENPYNLTQKEHNKSNHNIEKLNEQFVNRKVSNMIPIATEAPEVFKIGTTKATSSIEEDYGTQLSTYETDKIEMDKSEPHTYYVTEEESEELPQTPAPITEISKNQFSDEDFSTDIPEEDIFPPTSTSETILLIPPNEEEEEQRINPPWPTDESAYDTNGNKQHKFQELEKITTKSQNIVGGRSTITKIIQPSQHSPTAEEYFHTTHRSTSSSSLRDNEYQSNELSTNYFNTEETVPARVGMDWYFENYKSGKTNQNENNDRFINFIDSQRNNSQRIFFKLDLILILLVSIYLI